MILILYFIASCSCDVPPQGLGIPIVPTNDDQCFIHAPMSVLFWIKPVQESFESEKNYDSVLCFPKFYMEPFFNDMRVRNNKFKSIHHRQNLETCMVSIDEKLSLNMEASPINWLEIISLLPFEVQDKKTFAILEEDYNDPDPDSTFREADLSHLYVNSESVFRSNVIDVQDDATKFLIVPFNYNVRNKLTEFPKFIEQNGRYELFSISMTSSYPLHTWSWVHLKKNGTKLWYNLNDIKSTVVSKEDKPKGSEEEDIFESVGVYVKSNEYDSLIYPIVESSPDVTIEPHGAAVQPDVAVGPNSIAVGTDSIAVETDSIAVGPDRIAVKPDGVASISWELKLFRALLIFALIRL